MKPMKKVIIGNVRDSTFRKIGENVKKIGIREIYESTEKDFEHVKYVKVTKNYILNSRDIDDI